MVTQTNAPLRSVMSASRTAIAIVAGVLLLLPFATTTMAAIGNDFMVTELRYDLVATAGDYATLVDAASNPRAPGGYTNAWLGLDLTTGGSATFSQVGLMTDEFGVRWFAFTEAPVQCLRGQSAFAGMGCEGAYGDYATLNGWQKVELVTYNQGFWIARVYDSTGSPTDVARFYSTSLQIYRAQVTSEQGWAWDTNPHLTMDFYRYHPTYFTPTEQQWPASDGTHNNWLHPASIQSGRVCPDYYDAAIHIAGDFRFWWFGSTIFGGDTCYVDWLF